MSSNSRRSSLSAPVSAPVEEAVSALTPGLHHEAAATLTVSSSSSPVPPTPPPKDSTFTQGDEPSSSSAPTTASVPAVATAMSKLGMKATEPEIDEPDLPMVIDISRSPDDLSYQEGDTEPTIRVEGDETGDIAKERDSDTTEGDITIAATQRRSDSPEHGESTLHSSGSGTGGEQVQEHPLRLDIHPPSPPPWNRTQMEGEGDEDTEEGRGLSGRSGRASPQRFMFSPAKAQRVHEYGNKPSHNRPLIPHSAYYFGPPPVEAAYGTEPMGQIGVHHPREIVRIERDYTGGELPQFAPIYPLELEGRITPTQFLETINAINEVLLSAHSLGHAFLDNALAYFTLQVSRAVKKTHYEKEMNRLHALIDGLNTEIYNPVGLHIKWPRPVAFLFLEIEYY